jgi:hypothetical protein
VSVVARECVRHWTLLVINADAVHRLRMLEKCVSAVEAAMILVPLEVRFVLATKAVVHVSVTINSMLCEMELAPSFETLGGNHVLRSILRVIKATLALGANVQHGWL